LGLNQPVHTIPKDEVQNKMKNRMIALLTVVAVGGLMLVGSATAQQTSTTQTTTTTQAPAPQSPTQGTPLNAGPGQSAPGHSWENHVNQREQNQQNRVANGVKNGKMTAGQAAHVENRENAIQNREAADEAEHNGHLTPQEKAHFQHAQNKVSKQIHNDKNPK
jgi:hypothetical protein